MKQTAAVQSIVDTALTSLPHDTALTSVSDDDLLRRLSALLRGSRRTESELVAHIGEVDRRRLYAREACSSMYTYCTQVLHLSEHEAYLRITAARAARQHPELLAMLADGRLHLSGIAKLAPHLTGENRETLLQRATHRSKQQIEELLAGVFPRPDVPALIRRLPMRNGSRPDEGASCEPRSSAADAVRPRPATGVAESGSRSNPALDGSDELGPDRVAPVPSHDSPGVTVQRNAPDFRVVPIAAARYRVQFTASAELRDKLARLRELMRSSVPDGDLAAIIEAAVSEKLQRLEARRFARTGTTVGARPAAGQGPSGTASPNSRQVPAAIRRAVHERDGGRCRYVDDHGRRCTSRERLEYHHRFPYGRGGDHSVGNVCLMCRTHNAYLSEVDFGPRAGPREVGVSASR